MTRETYAEMTLVDLKNKAKELGIKNISKLKKSEIIDELVKVSPNAIEKDGVILTEKIAPKIRETENNINKACYLPQNSKIAYFMIDAKALGSFPLFFLLSFQNSFTQCLCDSFRVPY